MIDIHMHSEFSIDSRDTPESLVAKGHERGLTAIALTEHENIASLPRAREEARRRGMEYVPGVEIGASIEVGGKSLSVHILGYFFTDEAPRIREICDSVRRASRLSTEAALRGFRALNIPITAEDVERSYPGRLSQWALRRMLRETGFAKDKPEAGRLMERAIAAGGGVAGASAEKFSALGVLEAMKADGATTFLAHPFWLTFPSRGGHSEETVWQTIFHMLQLGVDGLEAFNTSNDAGYSQVVLDYCRQHNLPASGGSDSHGADGVGEKPVDDALLRSIKRYRNGERILWNGADT